MELGLQSQEATSPAVDSATQEGEWPSSASNAGESFVRWVVSVDTDSDGFVAAAVDEDPPSVEGNAGLGLAPW